MIFKDQCRYAFGNLRKTLLRTILTAAGVSIGIGAMTSMVSVGLGTQRLVLRAFNEGNILSSIMVSPGESADTIPEDSLPALDSATTELFRTLPGVRDAFPRITIAGLLRYKDDEIFRRLEGMPAKILEEQIRDGTVELIAGRSYSEGERDVIVLSERIARRLAPDSTGLDSLVNTTVSFIAARAPRTGDEGNEVEATRAQPSRPPPQALPPGVPTFPFSELLDNMPLGIFEPVRLELTVVGVVKGGGSLTDFVGPSLFVPIELVEPLYAGAFQDLESILTGSTRSGGYSMVQVLAADVMAVRPVQDTIRAMGFTARSILDEIDQVRRGFMFMNSLLGTIGGVSLFVAAMMIVNTLVMAVLERTPEIGLLKSMGATDGDVMRLFLTEASIIGVVGDSGGLILGYVVARITNVVANIQFQRAGEVSVNLVAFTPFLILGGLAFAVIVSLLAGYYPARRAAKVDPVVALRHF
jgi:putative ABC transport system permease protein